MKRCFRRGLFGKYVYKGSYTLEAAWIVGISLLVTGALISLGYEMYHMVLDSMNTSCQVEQMSLVEMFRRKEMILSLIKR